MATEADRWLEDHPTVEIVLPDRTDGDWRAQSGYGWVGRAWLSRSSDVLVARTVLRAEGWEPKRFGRRLRIDPRDGYEAQRFAELVLELWPDVKRIQLRCD